MQLRPVFIYSLFLCLGAIGPGVLIADDDKNAEGSNKGPMEVVIQSVIDTEKVAKPAYLPHRAHQWLECGACHHGKGTDGKKIDFNTTLQIEKCEACHNSKTGLPEMIATLKQASHKLCMECHLQQDKDLARCSVCHTKKRS